MKKFVLSVFMFLTFSTAVFADAKTQIEKVNKIDELMQNPNFKIETILQEPQEKEISPKEMTNLQYDEANYHYMKINNFIDDNINYSKSGKMKY